MIETPFARGPLRLKNRLIKSAMSEQLGDRDHNPTTGLFRLYERWADGGVGLLISGNVMIDRHHLGEPKNVVLDQQSDLDRFKQWAQSGNRGDCPVWLQLNHPGKQSPAVLVKEPLAPSAIPLGRGLEKSFNKPRELTEAEIEEIIEKFASSAAKAKSCGFNGVQIHGAHGYLVSQFLSPRHNQRKDRWGGDLQNRCRFLREVYLAMRDQVGEEFPIGLKINSADFLNGGFSEEECVQVVIEMEKLGLNLVEISGGNYESPQMMSASKGGREGYFLKCGEDIRKVSPVPLMITGGFRSTRVMNEALGAGKTDFIGLARPLAIDPLFPQKILSEGLEKIEISHPTTGFRSIDRMGMLSVTWYEQQLALMARGREPDPHLSSWKAIWSTLWGMGGAAFKKRRA